MTYSLSPSYDEEFPGDSVLSPGRGAARVPTTSLVSMALRLKQSVCLSPAPSSDVLAFVPTWEGMLVFSHVVLRSHGDAYNEDMIPLDTYLCKLTADIFLGSLSGLSFSFSSPFIVRALVMALDFVIPRDRCSQYHQRSFLTSSS